jgi:phosphoglycerate dehydrogenase-like enzyme
MRVVGTNLILPENDNLLDAFYPVERKEEMFGIADFVVLIVPYTLETHHLIGEEQLKAMKNTAYLINVARGKVIDEAVLIKALKEKWIAGAGLDVQYTEPLPPDNQLWNLENVILTPHTAAISSRYMDRAVAVFCDNLKRFVEDKELKFEFK